VFTGGLLPLRLKRIGSGRELLKSSSDDGEIPGESKQEHCVPWPSRYFLKDMTLYMTEVPVLSERALGPLRYTIYNRLL